MFAGKGRQLSVFLGEGDQYHHQPLYMAILERFRKEGGGGATVVRGVAGFGASSLIHTASIVRLSTDLPVVLTVIDRPERIARLIEVVVEMAPHALVVTQEVDVAHSGVPFREGLPDVPVSGVMRRDVVTVPPDTSIATVLGLLLDKDFTAVPVVDADRRLVGMVSDSDLLTRGGVQLSLGLQRATDQAFLDQLHRALANPDRRVSEIMTRTVVTTSADASLGAAARTMVDHGLKRLPVVDERGRLVGMLGRLDVLNTLAAVHLAEWHPEAHVTGPHATVGDVMARDVAAVPPDADIETVFTHLVASPHKRVIVVDESRHILGIISDSDLMSRVGREHWPGLVELFVARVPIDRIGGSARRHLQRLRGKTAGALMSPDVVTAREEMPVGSALVLSAEQHIKRIPVVNAADQLVGVVGRAELLRALMRTS